MKLLNKRSEVLSKCHHRNKYKLKTLTIKKKEKRPWYYIILKVADYRSPQNSCSEKF